MKLSKIAGFFALVVLSFQLVYCQECSELPVGLNYREKIPDHYITATSSYDKTTLPYFARIDSKSSWRPLNKDNNKDFLQVDLGRDYQLCAIGTKGGTNNQWTKKYELSLSFDNHSWFKYEEHGNVKLFGGNWDGDSLRKHLLITKPIARFVRVYPIDYNQWKAIRLELYGSSVENCKNSLGLENYGIDNTHITTNNPDRDSSHHSARLHGTSSWQPPTNAQWLQVDLGEMKFVKGIATQGDPTRLSWVTSFTLELQSPSGIWYEYTPSENKEIFDGNVDSTGVRVHWFDVTHHVRYIRVTPKTWHNKIALRMELYGCGKTCDNQPIAIQKSNLVSDSNTTPKSNALSNSTSNAYCFNDQYTILRVDLDSTYMICAVETRSTKESCVESYSIQTSLDGKVWSDYKPDGNYGSGVSLSGNVDQNSSKKNVLDKLIFARFLKFSIAKNDGKIRCMNVYLYGVTKDAADNSIAGASTTGQLPQYRFTANSQLSAHRDPAKARLHGPSCWSPSNNYQQDYLQIDLGNPWVICAVATQGYKDELVSTYRLSYSMNGDLWNVYSHENSEVTFHQYGSIKKHVLPSHVTARFVRFNPLSYTRNKALRVEVYGVSQAWKGSLGIEQFNGAFNVTDRQLTASAFLDAFHTEKDGRLYGPSSWCTNKYHNPYFQVDLLSPMQVTGLALQGNPAADHYIDEFDLQYSFSSDRWRTIEALDGNHDNNGVRAHWFSPSLGARYVRVIPIDWQGMICLRLDLYGNNNAPPPIITSAKLIGELLPTSSSHVTLQCIAYGDSTMQIKWFVNGSDITNKSRGQVYSRGELVTSLQVNLTKELLNLSDCDGDVCKAVFSCQGKYKNDYGEKKNIDISIDMNAVTATSMVFTQSMIDLPTVQSLGSDNPITEQIVYISKGSKQASLLSYYLQFVSVIVVLQSISQ